MTITIQQGRPISREVLTANRTYYVRTDGSDSNTGLVDSAGGAFLTKQKAIDTIYGLDCNGKIVTVDVGNGTYTGAAVATGPLPGGGTLVFVGDTSTPGNVDVNVTNANAFVAGDGASMIVRGFCITTTTAGVCLWGVNRGRIDFSSIEFGTCAGDHILGSLGGVVAAEGNYAVIGNVVGNHWHAYDNGLVLVQSRTVTLTGTPSFGRWACVAMCATIECAGNTYSGSGTGPRYLAWRNGAINTEGAAVTALPGNVDGSCSDGGRYT